MNQLSPRWEERLREEILLRSLQDAEEQILDCAVECATLHTPEPDDYSRTGNSRYGGMPDLPEDLAWPRTGDLYTSFLMQINLADVPRFQGNWLPERGMLYFFVDEDEAYVLYADVDIANLKRTTPPGYKDGQYDTQNAATDWYDDLKPFRLSLQTAIDVPDWYSEPFAIITNTLETSASDANAGTEASDRYHTLCRELLGRTRNDWDAKWSGKLLGLPCWIGYVPDWAEEWRGGPLPTDRVFLAFLNSNSSVSALFGDAGYLQVYTSGEKLQAGLSDSIFTELESS